MVDLTTGGKATIYRVDILGAIKSEAASFAAAKGGDA
jgi:hypothetical protein